MTLALSYGLVSLYKQLNLYKMRYLSALDTDIRYKKIIEYYNDFESKTDKELFQNPLELQGIRIGEINNDVESTFILKEIFGDFFDGFICPTLFSPYFDDNNIPNEILLFNPLSTIIEINSIPSNSETVNISKILLKNNINLFTVPFFMKNNDKTYFHHGGTKNNIDYIFEKNILINNKINLTDLKEQGYEFKKNMINNKFVILNKEDYIFNRNTEINNSKINL